MTSTRFKRAAPRASPPWELRFVRPPYANLEANGGLPARAEPGTLAFIRLAGVDPAADLRWIRRAEKEIGPCPIILEVMGLSGPDERVGGNPPSLPPFLPPSLATSFGLLTSRAGLRGVHLTTLGPAQRNEVRHCMTSTVDLVRSARLWLYRTHPELGDAAADAAVQCIGEGAEIPDSVGASQASRRTAARYLSSAGLPPPSLLRAVGRLLPPILELQANPGLPVPVVARPLFPTEQAWKKALRRLIGGSVEGIRACWGVEAALARSFNRWRGWDAIGHF